MRNKYFTLLLLLGLMISFTSLSNAVASPRGGSGKKDACHLALVSTQDPEINARFTSEEIEDIQDWILTQSESPTILKDLFYSSDFRQWLGAKVAQSENSTDTEKRDLVVRYIGEKLLGLETVSDLRRDASLALELQDVLPTSPNKTHVFQLDPNSELWRLSQANLHSWWDKFSHRYPITSAEPEVLQMAAKAAKQIHFYTVKGLTSPRPKDLLPPFLGARELRHLRLGDENKFWPNHNSVTFEFIGGAANAYYSLNVKSTKIRIAYALDSDFVRVNGYMTPALKTPLPLLHFFTSWEDPKEKKNLARTFINENKFNLPKSVQSSRELADFLIQRPFEALNFNSLRRALADMIMTPTDGEMLLRLCFERWLTHLAKSEGPEVLKVHLKRAKRGGLQVLYQRFIEEGLRLPQGFHIHVPVTAPSDHLKLLEIEPIVYSPWADLQKKSQSPRDSRRLRREDN